jgi:hypothetical protein
MNLRLSLSMLLRVIGGLVVLCGEATSPAVAKHYHDHIAHHGSHGGASTVESDIKGKLGTKEVDAKEGWKDEGKGKENTGEVTPLEQQGNTKPETDGKSEVNGDDRGAKPAWSEKNPIDTSNTITGPPPFARVPKKQSAGVRKSWTHRSATFNKGATKRSLVRNAIGQPVKKANADHKGLPGKSDQPPTVNGIHVSTDPQATSGTRAAAPNLQPKPAIPLAWSLGRPHDQPPANLAPYREGLNGRIMIRVGTGTGTIGGGANINVGVLNGSSFHPKQR